MTGQGKSQETLNTDQKNCTTFTKKKGCFISRGLGAFLVLLFIAAIVLTAVLVYYYAPAVKGDSSNDAQGSQQYQYPDTTMEPQITTQTQMPDQSAIPHPPPVKEKLNVRLPRSIEPLHYTVKLQPFINGNFSIHGFVDIEMIVKHKTNNVSLHIADIITHNNTIKLTTMESPSRMIKIIRHEYDVDRQLYIAHLNEYLQPNNKYNLKMNFVGLLNDELAGFYRSSYKDENGDLKYLATTQFQPTDARRAFPCFDEPGLKATFSISIARQTNMSAISNMPKISTEEIEDQPGWVWDHFDKTVPMSTYLVAFVVSDFANRTADQTADSKSAFRVWARKEAIEQAEYSRKIGPIILKFFEDYFNIPFPLPKTDMIALPDFSAGAMENWGLITYRETAMLYDPEVSAAANKERVGTVVAHELAHQWFGNLVTPEWWTDLWLNEGFASYLEYVGTHAAEPTWKILEQFVIVDLQDVFAVDCLESSHPISIPVGHPDEISEIFDRISYGKGASIIRMMSHFLTEKSFRDGLTNYLNFLKYKNAEQDDLWKFLTDEAHAQGTLPSNLTVKEVMDTWTLQMGYPVITVTRDDDGKAILNQKRFLLVKQEQSTDTHDYKWWVPITYTTQKNPDFESTKPTRWMSDMDSDIIIEGLPPKSDWVIFNIQETGYYRVNYDQENWDALIKQLGRNHDFIHVVNRAQIIDDALDLARAGMLSYNTALGIIAYLNKETEYTPWAAALNNLGYLEDMFTETPSFENLRKYYLSILLPLYDNVGFEDKLTDEHLDQYKRVKAISWACSLKHPDCVNNAKSLFKSWMQNPSNNSIVSPNIKSSVYCTAIKYGGEEEWNFAWERLQSSNVGTEKAKLLSALGCSNDTAVLLKYLEKAFTDNSGIRKQDATRVFGSIAGNKAGYKLAWDYLRTNWTTIHKYFGPGNLGSRSRIVDYGTRNFKTQQQLDELNEFSERYSSTIGSGLRTLEQAIEKTRNNIAWMDRSYQVISEWLETKLSS